MDVLHGIWMRYCLSALETAQATAITLSYRLPKLAETSFFPTADGLLEAHRMVAEKMIASVEGTTAAIDKTCSFMVQASSFPSDATQITAALLAIPIAAAEPARLQVHANAKRLAPR